MTEEIPTDVRARGLVALACMATFGGRPPAAGAAVPDVSRIEIPHQKFVLDNGLTLIVHEDRKAPIVAVNVWYHVGSKNEKPGKTGFAHLFEHLMFNGSEHFNDDYFKVLQTLGATDMNGTTNSDRTNYFQNVPRTALDTVLWMESDRMGHMVGAIDQARLDEQRGVVQNEKRQGENQPYGLVWNLISENAYPQGHPYSWSTIGSMEDLNAASLEDVKEWFKTYYGAANAVLVVAGDVDAAEVKQKVEHYFGDVPPGPPIAKQEVWIAERSGTRRQVLQDRVPQSRVHKVWNVPEWSSPEHDQLELVALLLSSGKTSRLYKRLVYDDQTATDVDAFLWSGEIGSRFVVRATVRPGEDLAKVEAAIDAELARLLAEGPSAAELERVKTETIAGFVRGIERIGGFGGKSDVLAQSHVFGGRPDYYRTQLERVSTATPAELKQTAVRWLSDGVYVLEVRPYPELKAAAQGADRSKVPDAGTPPEARLPDVVRTTLDNGLNLVVARRSAVPVVELRLLVDAGYAADHGRTPGTAELAGDMLDEGTRTRTALEISEELARLGAQLDTGSSVDTTVVSLSALEANLGASLEILADVVLNPSFPQADFERLKKQQQAAIQREKVSPFSMALRVLPGLLYGREHAYGNPLTGSGTEESVGRIAREDLVRFHADWFKPNNATLVAVGDTSLEKLRPLVEKLLGGWRRGDVPQKRLGAVSPPESSSVYLLDRPDSIQSLLIAGQVAPPKANPQEPAIEAVNMVLGGQFISRLNMNLREDKHWSYGARTAFLDARGPRLFVAWAQVQTDKTKESLVEMRKELAGIRGEIPIRDAELDQAQRALTLTLPGRWETNDNVADALADIVQYALASDYFEERTRAVRGLGLKELGEAASLIEPGRIVWVVVGDRSKVEAGIQELGLGPLRRIDADGKLLE